MPNYAVLLFNSAEYLYFIEIFQLEKKFFLPTL